MHPVRKAAYLLNIEAEVDDITVLDNIVLSFYPGISQFLCLYIISGFHQFVELGDLGPDESLFKIGMDLACGLGGLRAPLYLPCAEFLLACREIKDKTERRNGP